MIVETMEIKISKVNSDNFNISSLDKFNRFQRVEECWRKVNGKYELLPVRYTEDWDIEELRALAKRILSETADGGIAYTARLNGEVIGFALLDKTPFGTESRYIDLSEFYVSAEYRRLGAGGLLFKAACRGAVALGGQKLYISAHSAKESIYAYQSYGCVPAKEINGRLAEKEPCDVPLEFDLDGL